MKIWFDIDISYEELQKLELLRGKRTQMEYLKEALLEKMEKDYKEATRLKPAELKAHED